jgi:septal ring factor EnvC (AmiA/AmiB activator)
LNALSDVEKKLRESLSTIDELKSDLYRANKEIKELQKQVIGLQEQRDKLLALQDDLMRRISEYESLRMSAKDKGMYAVNTQTNSNDYLKAMLVHDKYKDVICYDIKR